MPGNSLATCGRQLGWSLQKKAGHSKSHYSLPFGQQSLWGISVITSLFSVVPFVGTELVQWLWGGFNRRAWAGNPGGTTPPKILLIAGKSFKFLATFYFMSMILKKSKNVNNLFTV